MDSAYVPQSRIFRRALRAEPVLTSLPRPSGLHVSGAARSSTLTPTRLLYRAEGQAQQRMALDQGVVDLGISMPELGIVKLSDLASIVGPNKQPVMRDRYFEAVRPLSEYLRLAQENGSIVD